jgi:uncharacterized protein YlxW (UPF0749 family)
MLGLQTIRRGTARRAACLALVVAVSLAVAAIGATPAAADADSQLAHDRELAAETARQIDQVEAEAADLEQQISTTTSTIGSLRQEARRLRREVRRRAASLYTTAGTHLDAVVQTDDVLDGARAAQLTEVTNRNGMAAATRLGTVGDALEQRTRELRAARSELDQRRAVLEAERAEFERRIDAAVAASQASSPATARNVAASPSNSVGASDDVWLRFRECTFAHESGGDYSIVSPDGVYYGAWQFLPGTWNAVAAGMGRSDLVGVLPSQAAPADQDAVAHELWMQRGNQPWGGRC